MHRYPVTMVPYAVHIHCRESSIFKHNLNIFTIKKFQSLLFSLNPSWSMSWLFLFQSITGTRVL